MALQCLLHEPERSRLVSRLRDVALEDLTAGADFLLLDILASQAHICPRCVHQYDQADLLLRRVQIAKGTSWLTGRGIPSPSDLSSPAIKDVYADSTTMMQGGNAARVSPLL